VVGGQRREGSVHPLSPAGDRIGGKLGGFGSGSGLLGPGYINIKHCGVTGEKGGIGKIPRKRKETGLMP